MGNEHTTGFCRQCNGVIKIERAGVNHILHLLLCIPTAGFWAIVWIILTIRSTWEGWSCAICGSSKVSTSIPHARALTDTHVKCPDCREVILAEARKCKHCGTKLIPQTPGR